MRDNVLNSSVRSLLPKDEQLIALVHMWSRHRLMFPFLAAAFVGLLVVTIVAGFEGWSSRIGLALAGAAVASMATTEYRVLAHTGRGLVLLRSSRVRQKATEVIDYLPDDTQVEPVGTNLVITDWRVGDQTYSVMRRHQSSMVAISNR